MRSLLAAKPVHTAGAIVANSREVAFMLRVRAHLADEKMWLHNGNFWPSYIDEQIRRGLYISPDDTPSCLLGTALLLQNTLAGRETSWGEKVVKRSMGFMTFQECYRFNDTCTHAELLARIDDAIVKLMEATC